MKRYWLRACGSLLAALVLGVRAEEPDPTVDILGFMDWTADGLMAIVVPDDQESWHGAFDFWASVNDAPTARAECQLSEPTYDWQFVASAEGALISPPDEESTTLTLDDEVNWGTTYTLSVTVIWQETGPSSAGPRGEIRATNTIQIAAMKVTADDIGNLCTKGPHSGHQVYVEIIPGDLGIPLELELSSEGEGSATFMENGDTTLTITESQWVEIEGWVASDFMDDMTLSGSFGTGTAFTKTFTIYDVDQLMAREQLHENNAATSGAEDDGTVLDICQEADGGANLLFNLDFWPWDAEGSKFLWDLVRADDEVAADEWAAQSGDFGEGEVSAAWNPDDPPATREFYLRAWFDCEETGEFDDTAPYRKLKIRVVDLDVLAAMCATHLENYVETDTRNDDSTVLEICQQTDGTASLDFILSWLPTGVEGSKFKWDIVGSDDAVPPEWDAPDGDFSNEGFDWSTWQPDAPATANREFKLRTWFDCDAAGAFDDSYPNRIIQVRVVDLDTLTLQGLHGSAVVSDTTRDNEERAQKNTLYIAEETNGTAQVMMDLSWRPEGVDGSKFHFQILPEGADMPSAQWDLADNTFEESSITLTWRNQAGGESNRVFEVNAWYDCNGNGERDDDEPCRQLFIVVAKAAYALDHVCPKGPHQAHDVLVRVEPGNESVPLTFELGRVAGLGNSGAAVFQGNNSSVLSLEITGSNTLTILGTQYSDQLTNMFMTAAINGAVCASNLFTVCDVDKLTATEDRHATNTMSTAQEGETKVLDICQGPSSNGAALLNATLLFHPTNDNHNLFRSVLTLLDGTLATNQWQPPQDLFRDGVTNQTLWYLPNTGPTNREFLLHGWFDCDAHGVYSNIYPHRDIKVRVVDLEKLTLTALPDNNSVADVTRSNETMTVSNTLYLAEGTNGMAQMKIEASWLPTAISADQFRWEILLPSGATSAQWQAQSGAFGQNPATVTWTNCANGETNRSFKVNAWYDCNRNGTNDVDEPHRQLFVMVYKAEVKAVTFGGSSFHAIYQDNGNGAYLAPHWTPTNSYPAAYTRNTTGEVAVTFNILPASLPGVTIRGDGSNGLNIPATNITSGVVTLSGLKFDGAFPNQVDFFNKMLIQWKLSPDGGAHWFDIGTSSNQVYCTWTNPVTSQLLHTLVDVGCRAAQGTGGIVGTDDAAVLDKVWAKLKSKNIRRASDNVLLTYYGFYDVNSNGVWDASIDINYNFPTNAGPPGCSIASAADLVHVGNGQCHSWAEFMHQVLCAQGLGNINGITNQCVAVMKKTNWDGFAVKNWAKTGQSPRQIINDDAGVDGSQAVAPNPIKNETADAAGAAGQGNSPNPPSGFRNHYIGLFNGKYYDPSYSLGPYADPKKYENDAFDGGIRWSATISAEVIDDLPIDDGDSNNHNDEINTYHPDNF